MPYIEIETFFDNTIMREIKNDNDVLTGYDIAPIDGYILHNTSLDTYEYDPETGEPIKIISKGYSPSSCSVLPSYDFEENPDKIYAIKIDSIGEDDIIY